MAIVPIRRDKLPFRFLPIKPYMHISKSLLPVAKRQFDAVPSLYESYSLFQLQFWG